MRFRRDKRQFIVMVRRCAPVPEHQRISFPAPIMFDGGKYALWGLRVDPQISEVDPRDYL